MNIDQVAEQIRRATKGFGTDEAALISAVVNISHQDIPRLEAYFKASYGKSIVDVIQNETSGQFGKLLAGAVQQECVVAAQNLHKAIAGVGTNEALLIETLVGRSNAEINGIKDAYRFLYNKDLEQAIKSEVGGDFKKLFVCLLQAQRDERGQYGDIATDVTAFYKAGEGKIGTDEQEFIRLLCNRSEAHLASVFQQYAQTHGNSIQKVIKKEFGGQLENALIAAANHTANRGLYFAELLESSMAGIGTDEEKIHRLVLRLRGAPIMQETKQAYLQKFNTTLEKRIQGEVSGDHEKLLLALVNQPARH